MTLNFSTLSYTLLFLLIPAVSINKYCCPSFSKYVSIASLVVPAIGLTITLFSPKILFKIELFPAFGLPVIATLIISSSYSVFNPLGNCSTTSSNKSPRPILFALDIAYGFPKPNS